MRWLWKEHFIQNEIRKNVNDITSNFRINVGVFKSEDGRFVSTGVQKDFRICLVLESQTEKQFFRNQKRKRKSETGTDTFLKTMQDYGAITRDS